MTKKEQKQAALKLAKENGYDNVVTIGENKLGRIFAAEHTNGGSYGMPAFIVATNENVRWASPFDEEFEKCMETLEKS